MMKLSCALSISVSCLVFTAGNVFAYSFSGTGPSSPLHSTSITSTTHTSTPGRFLLPDVLYTQIRKSTPARQVAESRLLVDGNFQNQSSTVILGLDPRIQVKQGFLSQLDSWVKPEDDNSAGIPSFATLKDRLARDDNSFLAAGTIRTPVRIYTEVMKPLADGVKLPQLASVCFISDTEDCRGFKGDTPCTGAGCNPDPGNRCTQEGYLKKACPAGQVAISTCPYDSGYVSGCRCRTDLLTCTKPYYGAGAECGGKYERCEKDIPRACEEQNPNFTNKCQSGWQVNPKDKCTYDPTYGTCCNKCEGYYLSSAMPSGYVADTSKTCASCDGTKYAKKCDFGSEGSGKPYVKCGSLGGVSSSGSCTDGSGTYYKECKCPTNYEWASSSKSCVCATSFKYSCSGTGYAGGTGTSCNSKWQKCDCATGYTWSNASGCIKCGSEFKFACTGANEVKPSTGGCGGLYTTCLCKTGYTRYCSNPATDCSSLGYKSATNCAGGLKCPWGNYWFCPS